MKNRIFGWMWNKQTLVLTVAAFFSFSMWFYVDRVWSPPSEMHFSDLYPRWYGSRELLLHGRDPYGPDVTWEIASWTYGNAVESERGQGNQGEDRLDYPLFAYPLYVAFILSPTVWLPYSKVESLFRLIMPALAFVSVPLWISALRWKCNWSTIGALALLSFGSFPTLENIYMQQPALLAAAFLAASAAALASNRLFLAGTLLAWGTIKPQFIFLLVPWLMLWAFSDWKSRKKLVQGFGITMFLLAGVSELFLPGWIREFIEGAFAYHHYTGNFSILTLLFRKSGGAVVSIGLVAGLALCTWQLRHEHAGSDRFNVALCLVFVVTLLIIPTMYPTGQILLLPCVFFALKKFSTIWAEGRSARLAHVAVCALIGWQWVGSSALMLAALTTPAATIRKLWVIPVSPLPLVPPAVLVLFSILAASMLSRRLSWVDTNAPEG